jgi:pimeloyl-ACP methyl ester carboxylesterase
MAEDIIVLLELLGWTSKRDLHVVGVSLGGMIAQELATRIPERIASLSLCVTTPGGRPWTNFPPWVGLYAVARTMITPDRAKKVPIIIPTLFPVAWLDEKAENDLTGKTNREIQTEAYLRRIDVTPPQTFSGSIAQMAAALTHHVSASRLHGISASIPKVLIVTGDKDHLVDARNSYHMKEHMPQAEFVQWKDTGHAVHLQRMAWFNALLEKVFKEGTAQVEREMSTTTDI